MAATVKPVALREVATQKRVEAELLNDITERQLRDWEEKWKPFMGRLEHLEVRRPPSESGHWNWRRKIRDIQDDLGKSKFSIMSEGLTQGLMIIDVGGRMCRIDEQSDEPLIYVEYVETAPWNRREFVNPPRYRGVGSILIAAAIEFSFEKEFEGRIGLHALPQANDFYDICGMTDLGQDENYDDLSYFEMTREQAEKFMMKGRKS